MTPSVELPRPVSIEDTDAHGSWILRSTSVLMFAFVAIFAAWFFSYTTSNRSALTPIGLQVVQAATPFESIDVMLPELLAAAPVTVYRTGLSTPTLWLRASIPADSAPRNRTVHFAEKNLEAAELVLRTTDGRVVLRASAGIAQAPVNARRTFPGFAVDIPHELNDQQLELIARVKPVGITKLRADLWGNNSFEDAQVKAQQRTTLLIGALMFLAVYALSAAQFGRVTHFLVFGFWLIARCGFVMGETGFNYFAFGEIAGSTVGLQLRQFAYLAFPFATALLVSHLFQEQIRSTRLESVMKFACAISGGLWIVSVVMPFGMFQISLWLAGAVVIASLMCVVAHGITRTRDMTTLWYLAGLACDGVASSVEILQITGVLPAVFSWFRLEQTSLIAAVLTGMAVGATIAKERGKRLRTQGEAIQVLGRYEAVYRTVPVGLMSVSAGGQIERCNEAFTAMFGEAAAADPISTYRLDADLHARIVSALAAAGECDFEFELPRDGKQRWVRVLARGTADAYEASVTDITEQKNVEQRLAYAAEHDALTGALNRVGLSRRVLALLEQASPERHAIAYVDLDRFKLVNDLFGHPAGDRVLVEVVARFRAALPEPTVIARVGGDEFVLLFEGASAHSHEAQGWKALEAITERPFDLSDKGFCITASLGVVSLTQTLTEAQLVAVADRACAEAKRKGRNQVVVCTDSGAMLQQHVDDLSLVTRLHDESTFDEFELVAQPIVSLRSSERLAFEVLLRHREPDGSLTSAVRYIAAAELNGEMARIDRWVLRRSLEWLSKNLAQLPHLDFMTVNLSGSSLNDEFFKAFAVALLQKYRAIAHLVVIEITETVAMQDVFMIRRFIQSVRQTGARIALDDFGKGYSNFSSLSEVQASFLKIDGEFVRALAQQESGATIIRTMTMLAQQMGMECIAEWVENAETLGKLIAIGSDYGQGYALCKPITLDALLHAPHTHDFVQDPAVRLEMNLPPREAQASHAASPGAAVAALA